MPRDTPELLELLEAAKGMVKQAGTVSHMRYLGGPLLRLDRAIEAAASVLAIRAAAPDLLLALESLTDPEGHIWHGNNDGCTGECQEVRAAIAKARAHETLRLDLCRTIPTA